MKPKPKTKQELDQIAHNETLNLNTIINPHGIPAEVYETPNLPFCDICKVYTTRLDLHNQTNHSQNHTCGALLKHHLGYICPECGKITK